MLRRRPLIALVAALALWAASLKAYLTGGIDLTSAGIRFLVAFAAAWVGVTVLGTVVAGYGRGPSGPAERRTAATPEPSPRRRHTDAGEPGGERVGVDDS